MGYTEPIYCPTSDENVGKDFRIIGPHLVDRYGGTLKRGPNFDMSSPPVKVLPLLFFSKGIVHLRNIHFGVGRKILDLLFF